MFSYNAEINQDTDGRFVVTFTNLPYGVTDGETLEEALFEAIDCVDEVIAGIIERGESLPENEHAKEGQYPVELSAHMAIKAALYCAMKDDGVTKVAMAKMIERNEKEVRRMLDPHHNTKLKSLEYALHKIGRRLKVEMVSYQ